MSIVSKLVQMEERKGTERFFWNRVRYEKMIDVGIDFLGSLAPF